MTNLWQQIADNKGEWIGGVLSYEKCDAVIKDIKITKNNHGDFFEVCGDKFSVGSDMYNGGLLWRQDEDTIAISGSKGVFTMHKSTEQEGLSLET